MTSVVPILLAVNAGLLIAGFLYTLAARRCYCHLRTVDQVLTQVCVDAFVRQHTPVWQAWMATMGDLDVQVSAKRKRWSQG